MVHSALIPPVGAHTLPEERWHWAAALWNRIDRDSSETVTLQELCCDEFQTALRSILAPQALGTRAVTYGRAEVNLQQFLTYVLRKADVNNDGKLSFEEFVAFTENLSSNSVTEATDIVFALFDLDCDQHLDINEFREVCRYFLGCRPTEPDFLAEWQRLDAPGHGRVSKDQYMKWLRGSASAHIRRSATALDKIDVVTGLCRPRNVARNNVIHRPAPGLVPKTREPSLQPAWNNPWANKDPSEQNLAYRGNNRAKALFSRPQSLPELRRFYRTYSGFHNNLAKLESPEPVKPKPVLSTDSVVALSMAGSDRHIPGGKMRNFKGEEVPWQEQTPRALKKQVWKPGSLLLRVPVHSENLSV